MMSAAAIAAPLPAHSRLLLDQQDIQALQQRIAQQPWKETWAACKKVVDKSLSQPVELPPRGGNWSHNYVCPQHGGRVASQSLSEASWLIPMAQGADLIWDVLPADQRRAVEEKLFRPTLNAVILPSTRGIQNIRCWLNSAIGSVGCLLGNERLIQMAIDDPKRGFRQQIQQSVRDDGMRFEGAGGCHFYTIRGLWPLAEAACHCGAIFTYLVGQFVDRTGYSPVFGAVGLLAVVACPGLFTLVGRVERMELPRL